MTWNSTNTSLLIHSHNDVDTSNNSYYGASGLYIMLVLLLCFLATIIITMILDILLQIVITH